jgi:hypothetical protein
MAILRLFSMLVESLQQTCHLIAAECPLRLGVKPKKPGPAPLLQGVPARANQWNSYDSFRVKTLPLWRSNRTSGPSGFAGNPASYALQSRHQEFALEDEFLRQI